MLARSHTGVRDLFASVGVHAPAVGSRSVDLGGFEKAFFVACWDVAADECNWTQIIGTFDVAHAALGSSSAEGAAAIDGFTSLWIYAPALTSGSVALGRFEVAIFRALREIAAGHGLSSVLNRFRARTDIFGALCSDRVDDEEN